MPGMKVTNSSDIELPHTTVGIHWPAAEGNGWCIQSTPSIPAGCSHELEPPTDSPFGAPGDKAVDPAMVRLSLNFTEELGIRWAAGTDLRGTEGADCHFKQGWVPFVPGGSVEVVTDTECPPLTDAEYEKCYDLVKAVLEGAGPVPPPRSGEEAESDALWGAACAVAGRPTGVRKRLKKMVAGRGKGQRWRAVMRKCARDPKPVAAEAEARESLASQLQTGSGGYLVIYHRALDRFPGGNCDIIVLRTSLDLSAGLGSVRRYGNWDGDGAISAGGALPAELISKAKEEIGPALAELLRAKSDGLFECTVNDNQMDDEEYDTEWSSIDVLVYASKPADANAAMKPLARVHRYAILPSVRFPRDGADAPSECREADPLASKVLAAVESALAVPRPEQFSEEGPDWVPEAQSSLDWLGYIVPHYLAEDYWPASAA